MSSTIDLEPIVSGLYAGVVIGLLAGVGDALAGGSGEDAILWGLYMGVSALATRTGLEPAVRKANERRKTR